MLTCPGNWGLTPRSVTVDVCCGTVAVILPILCCNTVEPGCWFCGKGGLLTVIGIGAGADLVTKAASGTGTVGRVSKEGCVIAPEGLILVAVPTDVETTVETASDPTAFGTLCVATCPELDTLVIVDVWRIGLVWDMMTLFNCVAVADVMLDTTVVF